jgi:hypothetical protein
MRKKEKGGERKSKDLKEGVRKGERDRRNENERERIREDNEERERERERKSRKERLTLVWTFSTESHSQL